MAEKTIVAQAASKASGALPHVGGILSAVVLVFTAICNELKKYDATILAEGELAEDANYVIGDIEMYRISLKTIDEVHLERFAKVLGKVQDTAQKINQHLSTVHGARMRHTVNCGHKLANLYECALNLNENVTVASLKKQLRDERSELLMEFEWIKMMEGGGLTAGGKSLAGYLRPQDDSPVRWIKREELERNGHLFKNMVPSGPAKDSEDGKPWYIARMPYFGSKQPGKFRKGEGAYYGFGGLSHTVGDLDYDVLVAEPDSVRWVRMNGRFSEERLLPARPVLGCHENDRNRTRLVIARAWAREHMRAGILTPMTLQPGKASPNLEHAYVTAGKKEKKIKVQEYEVLVYA